MKNPGNVKPYDKLWAIMSVDLLGNEGMCMISTQYGPQLAVTGSESLLELFLKDINTDQGRGEAKEAGLKIVIGEFTRTKTTDVE